MSAQCNLIIDSCCDLPLELVQQEGVQLIDFNYIIDDETFKDDFYQSVTPKEVLRQDSKWRHSKHLAGCARRNGSRFPRCY